jgi:cytochrome P450
MLFWSSETMLDTSTLVAIAILAYLAQQAVARIYSVLVGPLSKFPGPKINAFTLLALSISEYKGRQVEDVTKMHEKYGPVVRLSPNYVSFLGNEQTWRDIYGFKKQGQEMPHKDRRFYPLSLNGTASVFTDLDEAGHSRKRKLLANSFSDRALKEQEPLLKGWAGLLRRKLDETSGTPVDLVKMLNCTTFDIMADMTFGEGLGMLQDSEYSPWVKTIFGSIKQGTVMRQFKNYSALTNAMFESLLPLIPSIRSKLVEHWEYIVKRVDKRLARSDPHQDFWSNILMKSQGNTGMTKDEMYPTASLFMVAGTETTATLLSGLFFLLMKDPEQMRKLQAEIREAFGSFDDLHLDSLARCRYLEACLKEALRVYPPVPIGLTRTVPAGGSTINGHWVPAGTFVSVHQAATTRSETNFTDARSFRPERWLGDSKYSNDVLDANEPFSMGPRNCLGKVS